MHPVPIKPENRRRYPADWRAIRRRILARADHSCERCGLANYSLGGRLSDGTFLPLCATEVPLLGRVAWCGDGRRREQLRVIRIVLTIAHLDHCPENNADENLQALCQRCHLAHDQVHHQLNAYATRRAGRAVADLFDTGARVAEAFERADRSLSLRGRRPRRVGT